MILRRWVGLRVMQLHVHLAHVAVDMEGRYRGRSSRADLRNAGYRSEPESVRVLPSGTAIALITLQRSSMVTQGQHRTRPRSLCEDMSIPTGSPYAQLLAGGERNRTAAVLRSPG
jgi:hypothetical protein